MEVQTLFLDAGGVLVFPNWERVVDTLRRHGVEAAGQAMAEAEPRVRRELDTAVGIQTTTDRGRAEAYWDRILDLAAVPRGAATREALAELEAYHALHNLWELVPEGAATALGRCSEAGLRMAVVSNSNGTVRRKLARLGLSGFFATIVDSTEEGVEKPDPRIFHVALQRMGARAETTLPSMSLKGPSKSTATPRSRTGA